MARKQAADYEEKRDAIVEEAARLFAEKGFAGASLADLAFACDMSKSLFYHYYESKEAILYAVMAGHMDELLTALDADLTDNPHTDLRNFARRLLRLYAGAAVHHKVLLYDLGALAPAERADIVARERTLIAHVEKILAAAHPGVDKSRLKARTMLYFGMLNWTHTWLNPGGAVSRDEVADMAAAMALAPI